jgi:predicted membrane chloride channel (bestrophin family)
MAVLTMALQSLFNRTYSSLLGALLKVSEQQTGFEGTRKGWKASPSLLAGFQGVLGIYLVFRTAQSYSRYMTAATLVQLMQGSFFDAASSSLAFVKMSSADSHEIDQFRVTLISLFSALNAFALRRLVLSAQGTYEESKLEGAAQRVLQEVDVLFAGELNDDTIRAMSEPGNHVALIFHWIQSFLVDNLKSGLLNVPPPILSRAFQELAAGMSKFEDCLKLVLFPFPSPYTSTTLILMIVHAVLTPSLLCDLTEHAAMVFIFTFLFIFTFWAMHLVATELECPFDGNGLDMDMHSLQRHVNDRLLMMLTPRGTLKPALRQWSETLLKNPPNNLPVTTLNSNLSSDTSDSEGVDLEGLGSSRLTHSEGSRAHLRAAPAPVCW